MNQSSTSQPREVRAEASVLPLHGSRTHAPSSLLVRARLGESGGAPRSRAAVACLAEICDEASRTRGAEVRWWTDPVHLDGEVIAERALVSLADVDSALRDLRAARLLIPAERGDRIEPDILCETPALNTFDLAAARARLREKGELVGPTTALLRELVRLADAAGIASTTLPRLVDASMYGRTRVTQALSVLERLRLVERSDLTNRMVRLRLMDASEPLRRSEESSDRQDVITGRQRRMRLPVGASISIGGEPLELGEGMAPELELAPDGRYYLWIGPVRIGPYDP